MPPFKGFVPKNKNKIFYQKGRKSEGKRGCAEGCGNVVNPLGFPYFHAPERGGKGEVTFSLSRLWRRSLAPLFPLSARRRSPPQRIFFFASFFFWRCLYETTEETGIKPENSKTVNQWGLRGRIPVDPLKPQYIWDNYYDVPQTIYYLEENTREMTEEEKADFRADRKVFSQRYVKLIADERERLRKKARETE